MTTEALLALFLLVCFWLVVMIDYFREKREYTERMGAAASQPLTFREWILEKLHLPREKYMKKDLDE